MTKTQIKTRLKRIIETLNNAQEALADLSYEVEDTISEIEPYENHENLTEAQEERQEWLEEALNTILDKANELTYIIDALEYIE